LFLLGPNILLNTLFSNTLSLRSFLTIRGGHTYGISMNCLNHLMTSIMAATTPFHIFPYLMLLFKFFLNNLQTRRKHSCSSIWIQCTSKPNCFLSYFLHTTSTFNFYNWVHIMTFFVAWQIVVFYL
jgi:hypothetical protein